MRIDAQPSFCEVLGCDRPATATYLRALGSRLVEFSICTGHDLRVHSGETPVVVAERLDLADLDGRTILILAPPQHDADEL